jgi:hypothetical protein
VHKVAIVQSNYIPWKGYFDLIDSVDTFMLFDAVQYTRRDWRNRNLIKTPQGLTWLTVPVEVKGRYHQAINETRIAGTDWAQSHWRSIEGAYRRAPHFKAEAEWLAPLFAAQPEDHLSAMNARFLRAICARLGITTPILHCEAYEMLDDRSARWRICVRRRGAMSMSLALPRGNICKTHPLPNAGSPSNGSTMRAILSILSFGVPLNMGSRCWI